MSKSMLLGCVAMLLFGALTDSVAQDRIGAAPSRWEHKAVPFGSDPDEAAKLLNELTAAGWEYVGPLAHDLVAFRRVILTEADIAAKKEYDRLQGTWMTVNAEIDGARQTEERRAERFTFSGQKWSTQLDDEVTQEGVFKIISIGPKFVALDLIVTDGYRQGDVWIGIYQIEGDRMKWCGCYMSESKIRAKALTTREDDGYYLRTLKQDNKMK